MEIGYTIHLMVIGIRKEVGQMMDTKKEITKKEKIDAEELAKELKNLPEAEKAKIYYMIKGLQLLTNNGIETKAVI